MVEYFALKSDLDVRIGLINGGSVRASIDEGKINREGGGGGGKGRGCRIIPGVFLQWYNLIGWSIDRVEKV